MRKTLAVAALIAGALDLAPSLAHAFEALPRLRWWSLDLWREATVFNGQFAVLGILGAPLEFGAIAAAGGLAWTMRREEGFRIACAACVGFALALVAWVVLVAPANAVLVTWHPGSLAADADAVRWQWEQGHLVAAAIKLVAFALLAWAAVKPSGSDPPV
ncbi:MAG: DUF1772 domain-containing protein [Hyphomicrobiales bacterium]|nr:MAG: DUF1772 domain-containing protein [Hyphomicrobiales bacterium]